MMFKWIQRRIKRVNCFKKRRNQSRMRLESSSCPGAVESSLGRGPRGFHALWMGRAREGWLGKTTLVEAEVG